MSINLVICARETVTWRNFLKYEPYSIALDGYVAGPPRLSLAGPHLNMNHHEGVDRLSTRSTTGQVLMNIKQGLFECFRHMDEPCATVYINDPDPDTCTAWWLLQNHYRVYHYHSEPMISRLVFAEDMLDSTAGAYPFHPDQAVMRQLAWIYEPYMSARMSGDLARLSAPQMRTIVEAVGSRISRYTLGQGEEIALDARYKQIYADTTSHWTMIEEIGPYARTTLFAAGFSAYIIVKELGEGKYSYVLGKMSQFIDFPIDKFYTLFNIADNCPHDSRDCWGGSDIIGGSPRLSHSKLAPDYVIGIIKSHLKNHYLG